MGEDNKEIVDQHVLAKSIAEKIKFEFRDMFLVKPLEPIMVEKTITTPKSEKQPTVDENGVDAVDYNETTSEVVKVESDFKKGIVIKVPESFYLDKNVGDTIKVGDVVVFSSTAGKHFDLLKDSRLIRVYDIIAIER